MVNAQEWLDRNYPRERRNRITQLDISSNSLQGPLNLERFNNLRSLICYENELTKLNLSDCTNLRELYCYNNQLTSLDFLNNLSEKKLRILNISNNNFSGYLTSFSRFVNLEELRISSYSSGRIQTRFYNHFYGSLEPLQGLAELKSLDIDNTDINKGLEYLSDNIQELKCSADKRPNAQVKTIEQELKRQKMPYERETPDYDILLKRWKANNIDRVNRIKVVQQTQRIRELKQINNLIFPNQPYDFSALQTEIRRLKIQELSPRVRREKTKLEQLITRIKSKVENNLTGIIDLLLQTKKQMIEQENESELLRGQMIAYQNILQIKLTQEELQILLNKQKEVIHLEKQLTNLGIGINYNSQSWNNIHSSFTSELVRIWVEHDFTAEQARDWINISPSSQQAQVIQEPEFYAWLRDEGYSPEQVLNDSSISVENLKRHFRQSQQTAQIQQNNLRNA